MSDSSPLVSIIMNCYNCERFLKEALDSIYAQTFTDWEILFWDNASGDTTPDIVAKYDQRLKYHRAETTAPLGEARNLVLQKACGKYISFLDSDDLYLPDKLAKQVELMEGSDYALCYGSVLVIDENGKETEQRPATNKSGNLLKTLLKRYEINMQTVMIRRSVLEVEGLTFRTDLKYNPDYNLFMLIAASHPVGVIPDYVAKYRVYPGSLSKKLYNRVAPEVKITLDALSERAGREDKELDAAYAFAYNKLHYYDAIYHLSEGRYRQAREELAGILLISPKYLVLYLLILFSLPKAVILKLLRRS